MAIKSRISFGFSIKLSKIFEITVKNVTVKKYVIQDLDYLSMSVDSTKWYENDKERTTLQFLKFYLLYLFIY